MYCLTVDDIVLVDENGMIHEDLLQFYEDYKAYKSQLGEEVLGPRRWISTTRRGVARKMLTQLLGGDLSRIFGRRSTPILIDLPDIPRPASLNDERLAQLLRILEIHKTKTWERLGRFDDLADEAVELVRLNRQASLGHLNILKGNIAEVFSLPLQVRILEAIKRGTSPPHLPHLLRGINRAYPDAVLLTGIRIGDGTSGARRLFSDNIIAHWRSDGSLQILMVFEVKSGYRGGAAAAEQIFEWVERRIEDGFQLFIPANARYYDVPVGEGTSGLLGRSLGDDIEMLTDEGLSGSRIGRGFAYTYDPDGTRSGDRVINLVSSQRQIITVNGASQIGIDPSSQVVGSRPPIELGLTSSELDYIKAKLLLDRYGAID